MKARCFILTALLLTACGETSPSATDTTIENTSHETQVLQNCMDLLYPDDGVEVPIGAKVIFSWTAVEQASQYQLNITLPAGERVTYETDKISRDRYLEVFKQSGEYQWNVIALAANGSPICSSETLSLVKLQKNKSGTKGCGSRGLCPDWSIPDPVSGCESD